ncbi:MAG: fibrobacter succinogenes major paralogous domain-containing protein [Chitinivibrionales bacterium]
MQYHKREPIVLAIMMVAGLVSGVCAQTVTDIDGNEYRTVTIGGRQWMAENLVVSQAPDGTPIERYCYNDDTASCDSFGALYTWDVAMNGSREQEAQGICPDCWHIPSDQEWKELEMALGMSAEDADQANVWRGTDQGTQLAVGGGSGFDFLQAGRREPSGAFALQNQVAYFWTSTEVENTSYAWRRCLSNTDATIGRWDTFSKEYGFSIRCIQDAQPVDLESAIDSICAVYDRIDTYQADVFIVKDNPCNIQQNQGLYYYEKPESALVVVGADTFTTFDQRGCESILDAYSVLVNPVLSVVPVHRMESLGITLQNADRDTFSLRLEVDNIVYDYYIERKRWLIVSIVCTGGQSFNADYYYEKIENDIPVLTMIAMQGDTSLNSGGYRFSNIRINGILPIEDRWRYSQISMHDRLQWNGGALYVDLEGFEPRKKTMSITNMRGQSVDNITIPADARHFRWNARKPMGAKLSAGAYIVRVLDDRGIILATAPVFLQ